MFDISSTINCHRSSHSMKCRSESRFQGRVDSQILRERHHNQKLKKAQVIMMWILEKSLEPSRIVWALVVPSVVSHPPSLTTKSTLRARTGQTCRPQTHTRTTCSAKIWFLKFKSSLVSSTRYRLKKHEFSPT